MFRYDKAVILATLALVCCAFSSPANCERVLIVTTDQFDLPSITGSRSGLYAASDLVGAGLPFDIRTYSKFVTMDLSPYDMIILSGHTSPVPVVDVAAACTAAKSAGKKIFINGFLPFRCYDSSGTLVEDFYYANSLFGASKGPNRTVSGTPTIPAWLEKDPLISAIGVNNAYLQSFALATPAPVEVTIGGLVVAFVGPDGGALRGTTEYEYSLLDYGKLVNYLRHGAPTIVGFANDRIDGQPIAAFHIDGHEPGNLATVDAVVGLADRYQIPFDCVLTYNALNSTAIDRWNSMSNPLIVAGSHSRTHPQDWYPLEDVLYESTEAWNDQKLILPATYNFFSFSGNANPTSTQMDDIHESGLLFAGQGMSLRSNRLPDGSYSYSQLMPISLWWFKNLAKCESTPTWPSMTTRDDSYCYTHSLDYRQVIAEEFEQNVKYELYTYGFIHDSYLNPKADKYVNGIRMYVYIDDAMRWLRDQGVRFIFAHDLILRLQDYVAGDISYIANPDGSVTVTVSRPGALANEIKIGFKGDLMPLASGSSIVAQYLVGRSVYVTLSPETSSTVQVQWVRVPPSPPVVSSEEAYVSNESTVEWTEPESPDEIAEYQYAVGTSPAGTDAQDWTSAGTSTGAVLSQASLQQGQTYYASVRARYSNSPWSDEGVSSALTADLSPPLGVIVYDDGATQWSTSRLHARWNCEDLESGIKVYTYAVGTSPGADDIVSWTTSVQAEVEITGLSLVRGGTYYVSVRARNKANLLSGIASSDGILVGPAPIPIGLVRRYPDTILVSLDGAMVTAVFPGEFYVESPDRSAGIRIASLASVDVGDIVSLTGWTARSGVERYLNADDVCVTGAGSVETLLLTNRDMGGYGDDVVPGPDRGVGLNNVGLLVTISGRITHVGDGYIYVDDGSIPLYSGGGEPGSGLRGVKVLVNTSNEFEQGSMVLATGIGLLETHDGNTHRLLRTRDGSDVVVLTP